MEVQGFCAECAAPLSWTLGTAMVRCEYCGSSVAIDPDSRAIRLACPSCGGDIYAVDGSMAARCPYCAASLLALTRQRLLRFAVAPAEGARAPSPGAMLTFVPFWHLAGVLMGWDVGKQTRLALEPSYGDVSGDQPDASPSMSTVEVGLVKVFEGRVLQSWLADTTALALGIGSLRLRAAVFPLEPFGPQHERLGAVLAPALSCAEANERLRAQAMGLGYAADGVRVECQRRDLVGESLSLLYYPFWVRRDAATGSVEAWDAVTREPEPVAAPGTAPQARASEVFDDLSVIELRCQRCGGALVSGPRPVVLPCQDCHTFWVAERDGLRPFAARYASARFECGDGEAIWLPYWQVHVRVQHCGAQAGTVAHLRQVLGVRPPPLADDVVCAEPATPLSYFVPAFGALKAPRLDPAARDLTRVQPRLEPAEPAEGALVSCFYAPEDAERLSYVVWLQLLAGAVPRRLRSLRIATDRVSLWYLPFARRGRELRSLVTGMRYDRQAFRVVGT